MILGSGMGMLGEYIENAWRIEYADIPGFPVGLTNISPSGEAIIDLAPLRTR